MINYKNIIDDFKLLVEKHKQLNSFGTGDIRQLIYLTQEIKGNDNTTDSAPVYPLMYVIPQPATRDENFNTFSFNIVVADIMNTKNYNDETELFSDTYQICEDIVAQFKYSVTSAQGDYEDKYDINLPVTISPFSEAYDDLLIGWTISLDIIVSNPLNRCIAPFKTF
jgi:hypothetical protein